MITGSKDAGVEAASTEDGIAAWGTKAAPEDREAKVCYAE
jgi:hypothetical protein